MKRRFQTPLSHVISQEMEEFSSTVAEAQNHTGITLTFPQLLNFKYFIHVLLLGQHFVFCAFKICLQNAFCPHWKEMDNTLPEASKSAFIK
jgi:hypothetical protein